MNLLQVKDLHTYFQSENSLVKAVRGVSFEVKEQETLAIIGESGSGKSQIALSILKLFQNNQTIVKGQIIFNQEVISDFDEHQMRKIRGQEISIIFQDPVSSLNPLLKIKTQIFEILKLRKGIYGQQAFLQSIQLLKQVEISDPYKILESYPYQLSGGLCQRISIAISLISRPKLLIADEPTTAIDVIVQQEILNLIKDMQRKYNMSMIFITHDLSIVASLVKNIIVLYKGMVIEKAPCEKIFSNPIHPYTKKLLNDFLSTSIYRSHIKLNENIYDAENDIFDFRNFKNYAEPDLDLYQVSDEHFISCTLKK
ncbi:MAG: ABC transporter ATP-binding protein [Pigeon pea little leaf phytoplasma]|uniref:ABC transporter ATP-binding protein n=1 Tax=Candidatus Phytoplasma fabacearum TaxID=2982628 RepID=A0ABU8ZSM4_9MOLU|nr:ABC transporter ATP-binding protein ['Bituminaria bituminosa' little leaf phytoplasma]MDV3148759.1 ABC transporter ATP-binding protein [Pigeon pea little leaf phytoplasma]MDO8024019.1 ABC transporter ATP-binding protein ['Bituminaria bituminosa' little leaf phytoplasma]MDO8030460.1 ABC transporter ATP-binding protein ['Bituminaria bituminosa' little leaf phytoplasma]MDV3154230.1 ABC transporter ATP-binding protein [Pigeon pea little leaf phytoplasma]MDV3158740.1 ABC transporter ATP-binding 